MKSKYLIKGFFKSIPGIEHVYNFHRNTGGTDSARYCYSVWLRHLVRAYDSGMQSMPVSIAELGPGDSLGIGLSALLSGAHRYAALDIVRFTGTEKNLAIFEELVTLFKNRTPVPLESEFPNIRPALKSYDFPSHILKEEYLAKTLDENRLQRIRHSILAIDDPAKISIGNMIQYKAPWSDAAVVETESADMILSQAVLQHVDDLELTYSAMYQWLRKGGWMSHVIDFKCMGSADTWDGHWTYSDAEWKIVRGRKSYLINREPCSTHLRLFREKQFEIICNDKMMSPSTIGSKSRLAKRFRNMKEEDLSISGVFVQAIK